MTKFQDSNKPRVPNFKNFWLLGLWILFGFLIFDFGFFILARPAHALTISPPIVELTLKAGQDAARTLHVFNESSQTMSYRAVWQIFSAKDQSGVPQLTAPKDQDFFVDWFSVSEQRFTLAPLSTKELFLKVALPPDVVSGEYHVALVWQPITATGQPPSVGVTTNVGMLIFLTVSGQPPHEQLTISQFYSQPANAILLASRAVKWNATVLNGGNVFLQPKGTLRIQTWYGRTVFVAPLNTELGRVLPNSERSFQSTWQPSPWSFGWYRAEAEFFYGEHNQRLYEHKSFWMISYYTIALIVFLLSIIGWRVYRRWRYVT